MDTRKLLRSIAGYHCGPRGYSRNAVVVQVSRLLPCGSGIGSWLARGLRDYLNTAERMAGECELQNERQGRGSRRAGRGQPRIVRIRERRSRPRYRERHVDGGRQREVGRTRQAAWSGGNVPNPKRNQEVAPRRKHAQRTPARRRQQRHSQAQSDAGAEGSSASKAGAEGATTAGGTTNDTKHTKGGKPTGPTDLHNFDRNICAIWCVRQA